MTFSNSRTIAGLIQLANPQTAEDERLLRRLSQLTHDHPELIEQLAEMVCSRLETNNRAASVREAFERLRWDIHIRMSNDLVPLMARALLYVHPDLNGMVQLISLPLDEALGMRVSDKKLPGEYARRLEWADGTPLSEPHAALGGRKPVQAQAVPTQGKLFKGAT
jgi:hypothetical protein